MWVKGPHASLVSLIFLVDGDRRHVRWVKWKERRRKAPLPQKLFWTQSKTNMKLEIEAQGM